MPSLLDLPPPVLESLFKQLPLDTLLPLRLVSRASFHAFAAPHLCAFLLTLHFPHSPSSHAPYYPTAYDALNTLLLRRRRLRGAEFTQTLDLHYPAKEKTTERIYPRTHYFDADAGALVMVESDLSRRTVEVSTRWLGEAGRCVVVPAPLEISQEEKTGEKGGEREVDCMPASPPEIFYADGRILLIYNRRPTGTKTAATCLATILDAQSDGNTLWTALISTPIHTTSSPTPVFNEHYLAFITSLTSTGAIAIAHMPPTPQSPTPDTIIASLLVRPSHLHSLVADPTGRWLLVGETYKNNYNLHRIVLIDAHTGAATRACNLPIATPFAQPARDWSFALSPGGEELLTFQSPRDATYRSQLLGQLAVFNLTSGTAVPTRVRYLLVPPLSLRADEKVEYTFATHNAAVISPFSTKKIEHSVRVVQYPHPRLTSTLAGTGEVLNRHNSLTPLFTTLITPPLKNTCPLSLHVGSSWVYMRSTILDGGGGEILHFLRLSDADSGMEGYAGSVRSTSGWATPASATMTGAEVDAHELAKRLAAMSAGTTGVARTKTGVEWKEYAEDYHHDQEYEGGWRVGADEGGLGLGLAGWWGGGLGKVTDVVKRANSEKNKNTGGGVGVGEDVRRVTSEGGSGSGSSKKWGWGRRWRSGSSATKRD